MCITGSDILLGLGCIKGKRICAGVGLFCPPPTPGTALRERNASPSKSSLLKVSWSSTVTIRHAPGEWHWSNEMILCPPRGQKLHYNHKTTISIQFNSLYSLSLSEMRNMLIGYLMWIGLMSVQVKWVTFVAFHKKSWKMEMCVCCM